MGLVTVDYLQARPGFSGASDETLEALIEDASNLVRLQVTPILDDVEAADLVDAIAEATGTSGTTGAGVIQGVVANMCRRGLSNPRGAVQETLGDYSYSMGSDGGVATLYLTARERKIVRKAAGKLGAGTLGMDGYLPLQYSERTATNSTDPWDAVEAGLD